MTRKTKPIYLLIAGALLLVVASIFIFLLIQAYSVNATNNVATVDEEIPKYNNIYAESTKDSVAPTDEPTENTTAIDNVIKAKGLYVDKSGNVYDSKKNKYTVTDGHIAIVYEGNVYKISVKHIKEVNPKDKKSESKPKSTEKKEKEDVKQNTSNSSNTNNQYNNTNNNTSNNTGSNSRPQGSGNVSVNQSPNVTKPTKPTKPTSNNKEPQKTVKLNYSALTLNKGDDFLLELVGAGNACVWGMDDELIQVIEPMGNQCRFWVIKSGTARAYVKYLGNTYYCTITVR